LESGGEAAKPDLLDHLSSVDREQAENARNLAESARLQNGGAHHHQNNGEVEKGSLEGDLSEKESVDSLSFRITCDDTSNSSLKQNIQR
jgi:hypothetical protein